MPCNTLHSLMPRIRSMSSVEFLDLIEEVSREVNNKYRKIGILCTTKTRKEKLYDTHLENVEVIYPTHFQQKKVSEIIISIIRKRATAKDKEYLDNLIKILLSKGAEKVLLACTDLGNLIKDDEATLDTTDILISSILNKMKA